MDRQFRIDNKIELLRKLSSAGLPTPRPKRFVDQGGNTEYGVAVDEVNGVRVDIIIRRRVATVSITGEGAEGAENALDNYFSTGTTVREDFTDLKQHDNIRLYGRTSRASTALPEFSRATQQRRVPRERDGVRKPIRTRRPRRRRG